MIRLRAKELATAKGISQAKLSRIADVDIKTMQKIFRYPYSIVTTETLNRIAKALDCSVLDLIEDVPDDKEK
jgi:DNA-binding Xre family transcriptional regulator